MENKKSQINKLKTVALIAGIFCLIVSTLTIINYFHTRNNSPIDSVALEELLQRFDDDQNNETLQKDIRKLDLIARKAYFTNQAQIRFGGYLLIGGALVFLIALRTMMKLKSKLPELDELGEVEDGWLQNIKSIKWMGIVGASIIAFAILLSFVLKYDISNEETLVSNNIVIENNEVASVEEEKPTVVEKEEKDTSVVEEVIEVDKPAVVAETTPKAVGTDKNYFPSNAEINKNFASFRGPGSIGISNHKNIPTDWDGASGKNIAWKIKVPKPGFNSPIIWGNKLFLAGADKTSQDIYCIDRLNGKIIWTKSTKASKVPRVTDDTGLSASTLTTDGKRVFGIFASGDIVCVDFYGKELWKKNIKAPSNHYGHSSSLQLHKNILLVQLDDSKGGIIYGLSSGTGDIVWQTSRKVQTSWASPILVNTGSRFEVILTADPFVSSYDPETGKQLWEVSCMTGEVGPSCAYSSGIVFAANEYAKLAAIKIGDPAKIIWENNDYLPEASSPVANDKYIFITTSYGDLACYDINTGDQYWETSFNEGFYSSPIIAEGKVYVLDMAGIMHIVKADKTYSQIAQPKLGERSVCTPATADGYIYIRGNSNLFGIKAQ